jgi:hypothetical protein
MGGRKQDERSGHGGVRASEGRAHFGTRPAGPGAGISSSVSANPSRVSAAPTMLSAKCAKRGI